MSNKNVSFEANVKILESILSDLESGELSLSNALKKFEKGIGLYSSCLDILESATSKISILETNLETGVLVEKPFNLEEY